MSMNYTPVNRDRLEEAMNKMAAVVSGGRDGANLTGKSGQKKFYATYTAAFTATQRLTRSPGNKARTLS
jgi:hypothetical protein